MKPIPLIILSVGIALSCEQMSRTTLTIGKPYKVAVSNVNDIHTVPLFIIIPLFMISLQLLELILLQ
jgi:hypothetical protein